MNIYKREVGMLATNCYVAVNEETKEGVIVDPGADCDSIMDMVEQAGVEKVVGILLTHGHSDHIGALNEVRKATGAPVFVGKGDDDCLTKADVNLSFFVGRSIECAPAENIVEDGQTGILSDSNIGLVDACCKIISDAKLREEMSVLSKQRAQVMMDKSSYVKCIVNAYECD